MWFISAILLALSLCADCFAVSACSSMTVKDSSWRKVLPVAAVFALVQAGLFMLGWLFGDLFVGFVGKLAPVIGFLLLLYVGGSMLLSAWKDERSPRDLNGISNILLGAVATSIDAFSVGISFSMDGDSGGDMLLKGIVLLVITFLTVVAGMKGGSYVGRRYGRPALWAGGSVLILIGLNILFNFI
ncbi:MAG: manganese efflux pump [Bacteroidales bacterium]|nr:manganese efflux pump [Bacteroidales bacterium]